MTIRELIVSYGFEIDKASEAKAEKGIQGFKKFASKLLNDIKVNISSDGISEFRKEAEANIRGIQSFAKKALGAVGIAFSIAGITNLSQAAADVEALGSQFSQVFGELEQEAASKLNTIAGDTGILANRMKGSFVQIAAFAKTTGMETADALGLSDRAMKAVADSAAFYDRELEAVTDSLQSFLKGNFENDAALGLSCTETTRNAAANALYGKSFKDLAEDQKQLTLLKMVEDANAASGALGQAAREADTWTNQLGNLKQALNDLRAAGGGLILKPAVAVLKLLTAGTQKAASAVAGLAKENGFLTRVTERYHALIKRLQPAVGRFTDTLSKGIGKGTEVVGKIVGKLGGAENALKLLALAAGIFLVAMNWQKVLDGAGKFLKFLGSIGKLFSPIGLKIAAAIAIVALLALLIEDFIHFLMGNDSVIGSIFDGLGIGAENAREMVLGVVKKLAEAWESIKGAASTAWGALKKLAEVIFGALAAFWQAWGGKITGLFRVTWNSMIGIINGFLKVVQGIANLISAIFTGDWAAAWEAVKEIFIGVFTIMENWLVATLQRIGLAIDMALSAISAVWNTVWGAISSFFGAIWDGIVAFFTETIPGVIDGFIEKVQGIPEWWEGIWQSVADFFGGIWDGITQTIGDIAQTIKDGFQEAVDWITSLPGQALKWGSDIVTGIADGIKGAIGKITDAVSGIAEKIKSFLHFSVPDEGPLTDYENWMPDFMGGLAKGITENRGKVLEEVKELASGMQVLLQAATAKPATVAASTVNNSSSSVIQNNTFNNSYSGGSMETQRNVSKAMKKSAVDATTQMARGLAWAR